LFSDDQVAENNPEMIDALLQTTAADRERITEVFFWKMKSAKKKKLFFVFDFSKELKTFSAKSFFFLFRNRFLFK